MLKDYGSLSSKRIRVDQKFDTARCLTRVRRYGTPLYKRESLFSLWEKLSVFSPGPLSRSFAQACFEGGDCEGTGCKGQAVKHLENNSDFQATVIFEYTYIFATLSLT